MRLARLHLKDGREIAVNPDQVVGISQDVGGVYLLYPVITQSDDMMFAPLSDTYEDATRELDEAMRNSPPAFELPEPDMLFPSGNKAYSSERMMDWLRKIGRI